MFYYRPILLWPDTFWRQKRHAILKFNFGLKNSTYNRLKHHWNFKNIILKRKKISFKKLNLFLMYRFRGKHFYENLRCKAEAQTLIWKGGLEAETNSYLGSGWEAGGNSLTLERREGTSSSVSPSSSLPRDSKPSQGDTWYNYFPYKRLSFSVALRTSSICLNWMFQRNSFTRIVVHLGPWEDRLDHWPQMVFTFVWSAAIFATNF